MAGIESIRRALANPNYRYYAMGSFASHLGTWVQRIAVGWLAWELTGSGFWLGIVAFAESFPFVVFSLWGGAVADRMGSMRMVGLTMLGTAGLAALFAYLAFAGAVNIWGVVILTAAIGSVHAFGR